MQTSASDTETFEIISFHNCQGGLGITLAEYQLSDASDDASSTLILVKDIRADGRAASDGRLRRGDKLVRVNGQPIRNMALPAAAKTLADAIESGRATLAVSRDPALAAAFGYVAAASSVIPEGDAGAESDCCQAEADAQQVVEPVPGRIEADSRDISSESGADRHADENVLSSGTLMPNFTDCHEGAGLFAGTSADVLSGGISPFPDISNDTALGKFDDLPFCSTPNSTLTDEISSNLWRKLAESNNSRAPPAGLSLEAMYADASKIKLEKLELAMSFLGIHLTKAEEVEVQRLVENGTGRVDFTRFVEKMRVLLRSRLSLLRRQSAASGPSAAGAVIGSSAMLPQAQSPRSSSSQSSSSRWPSRTVDRAAPDLHQSPPIGCCNRPQGADVSQQVSPITSSTQRPVSGRGTCESSSKLVTSSMKNRTRDTAQQTADAADETAMVRQMQARIRELEDTLKIRDQLCHTTELKAARMRQKFLTADAQCKSLQSRLELAEAARRASRRAEIDYEAVLLAVERALEDKQQVSGRTEQTTGSPPAAKRIAILGCQLRKAEESRKVYEVATERLLSFVRVAHEIADKSANPDKGSTSAASTSGEAEHGARSCGLTQRECRDLADRAMSIISATQSLLETQPLPFGWEEAYTADGKKYYLNHVTEETVWQHPLTKVARQKL